MVSAEYIVSILFLVKKNLQTNLNNIILAGDEGNATAVSDSSEYISKINNLLQDGSYTPLSHDPNS